MNDRQLQSENNSTTLALGSGGVLGIAHIGVIKAFIRAGLINQITDVWGSSIGALIGLFAALNFSEDEIIDFLHYGIDLTKFPDSVIPDYTKYFTLHSNLTAHSRFEAQLKSVYHPTRFFFNYAAGVVQAVKQMGECKGEYIEGVIERGISSMIHGKYKDRLTQAISQAKVNSECKNEDGKISQDTFNELSQIISGKKPLTFLALHQFRMLAPDLNLKDLYITAVNVSARPIKLEIFSHETAPDMPIKTAIHSSMAFPGKYAPVKYQNRLYADGGLLCTTPYEIIKKHNKNKKIIAVSFNKQSDTHSTYKPVSGILDYGRRLFSSIFIAQETSRSTEDYKSFIHINAHGIPIFNFNISSETQDTLVEHGYNAANKYILANQLDKAEQQETATAGYLAI
ncbi:MAG: patatin-like phospholipase family protein [Gammaproteobacteria bacterium]